MNRDFLIATGIISIFVFSSCETSSSSSPELKSNVTLQQKNGSKAEGLLTVVDLPNGGVHISGKVTGLEPNSSHGFHIHEKGDCSDPAAMNAGGHFNPDKEHVHGSSITNGKYAHQHAGDLGNIKANESGVAMIELHVEQLTLNKDNKYSISGKAFVIHADSDDEKTNPAGNSGKRILCGVIK